MPIHDWTPGGSASGDLYGSWNVSIRDVLNAGLLPEGYFALIERQAGIAIPDLSTLAIPASTLPASTSAPSTSMVDRATKKRRRRPNGEIIVVRDLRGLLVAAVELVSLGYKASRGHLRRFVSKVQQMIDSGVHVLVVDILPPTNLAPQNVHPLIWSHYSRSPAGLPAGRPVTVAAYQAEPPDSEVNPIAYVDWRAYGQALPDGPLFLSADYHVKVPLEAPYVDVRRRMPGFVRDIVQHPATP